MTAVMIFWGYGIPMVTVKANDVAAPQCPFSCLHASRYLCDRCWVDCLIDSVRHYANALDLDEGDPAIVNENVLANHNHEA
jgi:hypothetical protein